MEGKETSFLWLTQARWLVICSACGALVLGSLLLGQLVNLFGALSPVLMPFFFGAMIAYLGDPWADRLEAHPRINRTGAVIIVFALISLLAVLAFVLLLPAIYEQLAAVVKRIPSDLDRLRDAGIPWLGIAPEEVQQWLDLEYWRRWVAEQGREVARSSVPTVAQLSSFAADAFSRSSAALLSMVVNILIIPVFAFYLLRDWDRIIERLERLLPRRHAERVNDWVSEVDSVLGAFVRGQLSVMIGLSAIYAAGLWLVGLEGALLIGLLAGAVSFVPYMGLIIGLLVAGISALIQFQDVLHLVYVVLVFVVAQGLEGMLLTPLMVGDRIGLHPVAVILSVLLGEHFFGVAGMIVALPLAAVLMVMLRKAVRRYEASAYYSHRGGGNESRPAAKEI